MSQQSLAQSWMGVGVSITGNDTVRAEEIFKKLRDEAKGLVITADARNFAEHTGGKHEFYLELPGDPRERVIRWGQESGNGVKVIAGTHALSL